MNLSAARLGGGDGTGRGLGRGGGKKILGPVLLEMRDLVYLLLISRMIGPPTQHPRQKKKKTLASH